MLDIAQSGKSAYAIHIPAWAAAHELFAAEELSRYLKRITGATLDVKRSLRRSGRRTIILADLSHEATRALLPKDIGAGLKHDGHRIVSIGERLYIVSNEPAGVVFGMYEYLRRFAGCRFLDFAPRGEDVPHRDAIRHGAVDIVNNPAFWYRTLQVNARDEPREVLEKRLDWMAKNGYSHVLIHYAGMDGLFDGDASTSWGDYRAWLIPALTKRGLKTTLGHHNFRLLIPPEQYLEEHPEFFALIGGKRVASGQLEWCLSNPQLIETVSRRLIDLIKTNPETDTVALWPTDGTAEMCQCGACRKLDRPGDKDDTDWDHQYGVKDAAGVNVGRRGNRAKARRYLHMANHVAEQLAAVYPKLKLSVIAYVDTVDPPVRDFTLHPNIVVHCALYWRCNKHKLDDSRCLINRQYAATIADWLKIMDPRALLVTTYEAGMGCWKSLPHPVVHNLLHDWAYLQSRGIGGVKSNSFTKHWAAYGLNYVALSQALREERPKADELIADYCRGFFGPAAEPMRKLYLHWEDRMRRARINHVMPVPQRSLRPMFSASDLRRSRAWCDEAAKKTADPMLLWRIDRIRALIEYTAVNCDCPADAFLRYHAGDKLSAVDMNKLKAWVVRDGAFVGGHMLLDDDLFPTNFARRMLKGWLMEV